jgi:hypothetical protein
MKLTKTLKILAAAMFFWAFFPLLVTVDVLILRDFPLGPAAGQLLAVTLSGFWGYGISALSERLCPKGTCGWRLFCFNLLRYGGLLIPLAAGVGLFSAPSGVLPLPFLAAVPVTLVMAIVYFMGQSIFFKPYYEILKFSAVILHIVGGVALAVVTWLIRKEGEPANYSIDLVVVVFLIFISVYAISKSQGTLDFVMDRRGHKMSALPSNIRNYNLLLVCILLALLVLAFIFRGPIGAFIVLLKDGLLFVVKCLIALFFWLMSLFYSSSGEEASNGGTGELDLSQLDQGSGSIPDLTILILILVVAGLIVFNWKRIVSGFRKLWKGTRNLCRKLFWGRKEMRGRKDESMDYVDEEESLTEEESARGSGATGWKAWRKSYRLFRKMEDSEEKLRRGYRLMVEWLNLKGAHVHLSDTPLEILEKFESMKAEPAAGDVTEEYNGIRYGEKDADLQKMSQLAETLKRLESDARPAKGEKKARRVAAQ